MPRVGMRTYKDLKLRLIQSLYLRCTVLTNITVNSGRKDLQAFGRTVTSFVAGMRGSEQNLESMLT